MKRVAAYAGAALLVVAGGTGLAMRFAGPGAREGLLIAGGVALPLQIGAFALLLRLRAKPTGFLMGMVGGVAARVAAVAVVGVATLGTTDRARAEGLVLGLAGYLFVLLLMEPAFMGPSEDGNGEENGEP